MAVSIRSGRRFSPPFGLDCGVHIHRPDVISMIRVTKTEEQSRIVVTVDGQLSGDSITVVETCCSQAEANRKPVHLFLRDVSAVDQAGTVLLRRLAGKGVHLAASGLYTSYLVQTLGAGHTAAQDSPAGREHRSAETSRRTL